MKSFADQFFLMSSSNLVLSVVQKLRSPYFTTAMQKRNARKILKVRSPQSGTIFASMMWPLPPHCGVVFLSIPSLQLYSEHPPQSGTLFKSHTVHFLPPLPHQHTTLNNVLILFQKLLFLSPLPSIFKTAKDLLK